MVISRNGRQGRQGRIKRVAPVPTGLVQPSSFFIHNFSFSLACPSASSFFIFHSSFFIFPRLPFRLLIFHFSFIIFHFPSPALPPPHFSFFIHHFSFSPRPARIRHLTALCSRKAVPPCGSRYRVIFRAPS
jgi:hypothetical protein